MLSGENERRRLSVQLLELSIIRSLAINSMEELHLPALETIEKEEIVRHFNLNKTLMKQADLVIFQEMIRVSKQQVKGGLNFRELSERVTEFGFNWHHPDLKSGLVLQDEDLILRLKQGQQFVQITSRATLLSTGRILPTVYQLDNLSELRDQNSRKICLALGFWKSEQEPLFPDPRQFVVEGWDYREKWKVVQHLKKAKRVIAYMGPSWCRFHCGEQNMGSGDLTDGLFYFPEGLVHYIENHNVRPTQVFIDWVLTKKRTEPMTIIRKIQKSPFRGKQLENHLQRRLWDTSNFTVDLDWWIDQLPDKPLP